VEWSIFCPVVGSICNSVFIALLLSDVFVMCSAGELGSVGICIRSRLDVLLDRSPGVGGTVCGCYIANVNGFVLCASAVSG
jgi:hypothetical protein